MYKLFISIIFLLAFTTVKSQVNLQNGLLASFPFNSNTNDVSGNGVHGINHNAVLANDRFGNPNSAYQFNGIDQYIEIPGSTMMNNNYSFSLWVKVTEIPPYGTGSVATDYYKYTISAGKVGRDHSVSVNSMAGGGTYQGFVAGGHNAGTPSANHSNYGTLPDVTKWYHIVFTRDNANSKLYINGVLESTSSTGGTNPDWGTGTAYIMLGTRRSISQYFKGYIDDVCIYNRALSATEVSYLHNLAANTGSSLISLSANNTSINVGSTATITASGADSYTWSPAAGLTSSTGLSVTVNPTVTTTYTVTGEFNSCTCTSSASCNANKSITITVNAVTEINDESANKPHFKMTGSFSPNDDGIADEFNIETYNILNYYIQIFDVYGRIIYQGDNNQKWDGLGVQSGIYFYAITDIITTEGLRIQDRTELYNIPNSHGSVCLLK